LASLSPGANPGILDRLSGIAVEPCQGIVVVDLGPMRLKASCGFAALLDNSYPADQTFFVSKLTFPD
jgi:hypothetical protein